MIQTDMFAQSSGKNYVQTKTYLEEDGSKFLRHIDYYDELGMVLETVDVGINTTNTPIKVKTDYNRQLKPSYQWTPVPSIGLDYIDRYGVADAAEEAYGYYDSPYSDYEYDDFLQLTASTKPGDAWVGHPVTTVRTMVPAGVVKKYTVDTNGNLRNDSLFYQYGMLTSTTTTDEDGRSMTVYTDLYENKILERRGTGTDATDTYYVYDDYSRLRYVLPPMCQHCSTSEMSKYWYKYTYDDRGRCTEKQLPGCNAVKYWYDEANRIQSEQDGHLRSQLLYRNYKYDGIGRLILQTVNSTRGEATESNAKAVEVKNYYDDYASCRQDLQLLFSIWADSIYSKRPTLSVARGKLTATILTTGDGKRYFELYNYDTKGRLSYKLSAYGDKWLKSVYTSYNFVGDVSSVLESVYKHVDYPKYLIARRRTANTYYPGTRLLESTTITHIDKNKNTVSQVVSKPTYDVFGNVTSNDRPGTAADMTYTYDTLHGWLKGISSPSGFSQQLLREDATVPLFSGNIGSMQWRNTSNGEQHRYDYTYDELGRLINSDYSSSVLGTEGRFDESVKYNYNSSITSLQRNGMKNDGTFGTIDDLTISYNGNRLLKVTDEAEAVNYNGSLDFHDGADADSEYDYDRNGALTKDSNRGIKSITYDYGHHLSYVNMNKGRDLKSISYDYTSDGRKLYSRHSMTFRGAQGIVKQNSTDLYIDGLIVRDDKPLLWQFDGGYVDLDANGAATCWNYYITDHLGSTRKVVDSNNNIKETINYYPFGSEMRMQDPVQVFQPIRPRKEAGVLSAREWEASDTLQYRPIDENPKIKEAAIVINDFWQPYRFTGKELDKQNGLNWYDFGARLFDVAGVPMWTSVDPLAEQYYNITPYSYCMGNPVNMIDPDGCRSFNVVDAEGKVRTEILDDGIDGTFSIQECDFFFLKIAYDMQQENNEGQYDAFFNSLGLDTKGYEVACKARQLERETPNKYAYNSDAGDGDGFTRGTYKCNKFAYDVLTSTDVLKKVPQGKPYPQAKQYAGEECIINGQFVSSDNYQPRLGDVIGGSYPFSDATGHVEIVTRIFPGNSKFESTGAHVYGLGATNMGYKMVNKQNVSSNRVIIYNPVKISRPK